MSALGKDISCPSMSFYCMTDASPSFGCMNVISKVDYPKQWRVLTVDAEDDEFYPLLETHLEALFNTKVSLSVDLYVNLLVSMNCFHDFSLFVLSTAGGGRICGSAEG